MTREPFMLSDTAMVLLREHYHLYEIEVGRLKNSKTGPQHIARYASTANDLRHIVAEFVRELEALWLHADLAPIRSLDWHFALCGDLADEAESIFEQMPNHRVIQTEDYNQFLRVHLFVAAVSQASHEALSLHEREQS